MGHPVCADGGISQYEMQNSLTLPDQPHFLFIRPAFRENLTWNWMGLEWAHGYEHVAPLGLGSVARPATAASEADAKGSLTHLSRASKRALQPGVRGVKVTLMKRTAALAARTRLDITPEWDDIQICIITWAATWAAIQ